MSSTENGSECLFVPIGPLIPEKTTLRSTFPSGVHPPSAANFCTNFLSGSQEEHENGCNAPPILPT